MIFLLFIIGRYPGHDGGYVSDPYGATTPGGGHPAYGEHSPFQTVPNLGGGGGPNDPWVPPGDLGGHHNGMQAQVHTSSSSTFATFNESSNCCV